MITVTTAEKWWKGKVKPCIDQVTHWREPIIDKLVDSVDSVEGKVSHSVDGVHGCVTNCMNCVHCQMTNIVCSVHCHVTFIRVVRFGCWIWPWRFFMYSIVPQAPLEFPRTTLPVTWTVSIIPSPISWAMSMVMCIMWGMLSMHIKLWLVEFRACELHNPG